MDVTKISYDPSEFDERTRDIIELISKGFSRTSIPEHLAERHPGITKRMVDRDIEEAYISLGISEEKGSGSKSYNPAVLLANMVNNYNTETNALSYVLSANCEVSYAEDCSQLNERTLRIQTRSPITSLSRVYFRFPGRPDFKESPTISARAISVENSTVEYPASIEHQPIESHTARYRIIFNRPIPAMEVVDLNTSMFVKDWYVKTRTELINSWSKIPPTQSDYLNREFRNKFTYWGDFNVRGNISINCSFPRACPATLPEVRIYTPSWDRQNRLEARIYKSKEFTVNGTDPSSVGEAPVTNISLNTHNLPPCKICFVLGTIFGVNTLFTFFLNTLMQHYADKLSSGLPLEAVAVKKPTLFNRLILLVNDRG